MNRAKDPSEQDQQNIAQEIGEDPNRVAGIRDTGALSGRDDSAGGSGDRMEEGSSGNPTER